MEVVEKASAHEPKTRGKRYLDAEACTGLGDGKKAELFGQQVTTETGPPHYDNVGPTFVGKHETAGLYDARALKRRNTTTWRGTSKQEGLVEPGIPTHFALGSVSPHRHHAQLDLGNSSSMLQPLEFLPTRKLGNLVAKPIPEVDPT